MGDRLGARVHTLTRGQGTTALTELGGVQHRRAKYCPATSYWGSRMEGLSSAVSVAREEGKAERWLAEMHGHGRQGIVSTPA